MSSTEKKVTFRQWFHALLVVWILLGALLYFLHFGMGFYHGEPPWGWALCAAFALFPLGVAFGCSLLVARIWISQSTPLQKTCFTLLALAFGLPLFISFGFLWLLTHMAP